MSDFEQDPYQVLGLGASASSADVTRAWRRLARAAHPDSRPGDPAAAEQFRAICDAYALLSDPVRHAAWDHEHRAPSARRRTSPDQRAAAGPAFRPTAARPASGLVSGASLRVGPVHIQVSASAGVGPADPESDADPDRDADLDGDADLARLLAWLAPRWRKWPW